MFPEMKRMFCIGFWSSCGKRTAASCLERTGLCLSAAWEGAGRSDVNGFGDGAQQGRGWSQSKGLA